MIEQFHRPKSLEEALALREKPGAFFMGGGTKINSLDFSQEVREIISLEVLGLDKMEQTERAITMGALCTIQQILHTGWTPLLLKHACGFVVNRNLRNMSTLGGHLASSLSWQEVVPLLLVLETSISLAVSDGEKKLELSQYLSSSPNGLITKISIPRSSQRRVALHCESLSANDRPYIMGAVSLVKDGENIRKPLCALGGITERVIRLTSLEESLDGRPLPSRPELEELIVAKVEPRANPKANPKANPRANPQTSPAFQKYLAGTTLATLLIRAFSQGGVV